VTTQPPVPDGGAAPGTGPTPTEAAWIRDHVIPAAIHRTAGPDGCPCQWTGTTGHCARDAHDRCRSTTPIVYPDGWITWPDGHVASPAPADDVQVWRTGRPCRMPPCSCDCHTVHASSEPVQLDLFGAAA
jgi:hypothetical protein